MVFKGNAITTSSISEDVLQQHLDAAFSSYNRSKDSASEAAANAYLFYRYTLSGEPKKWFDEKIKDYTDTAEKDNAALKARFVRADMFMKGELDPEDRINKKPKDNAEKAEQEAEREQLRADHAIETVERRKLRFVALEGRDKASPFTTVVKFCFRFFHETQAQMVSRYCHALEWIHARFGETPNLDVDMIKDAFKKAKGFDVCVDEQSKMLTESEDLHDLRAIQTTIREKARKKVMELPVKGNVAINVVHPKDGFVLLLGHTDGASVSVVGEAELGDMEIDRAVNKLGSKLKPDADPASEFMGRVLEIADLVPEGVETVLDDGKNTKIQSQRMFTLKPISESQPQLVASAMRIDVSPILHARLRNPSIFAYNNGVAVLPLTERRKMEKQIRDAGRRSLVTISAELDPKTAEGKPAAGPMSWIFSNVAITTKHTAYWSHLANLSNRPLDVSGFEPQCTGSLDETDINMIITLLDKKSAAAASKVAESASLVVSEAPQTKTETKAEPAKAAKPAKKAASSPKDKVPRSVGILVKDGKMTLTYGDADPLVLNFANTSMDIIKLRIPSLALLETMKCLRNLDCTKVALILDDGGLVCFAWDDAFGFYELYQPTCGLDGKLITRRVNNMRLPAAQAIAAE